MAQLFADQARANIDGAHDDQTTTITLKASGELFPVADVGGGSLDSGDWFKAVLDDGTDYEIIYVRTHANGGSTFSNVLRGQEGTSAKSWADNDVVGIRPTATDAGAWRDKQDALAEIDKTDAESDSGSVIKGWTARRVWDAIKEAFSTLTAAEATKLATPRNIGGVAFDGTQNIDLPGVNQAGNQNTSGTAGDASKLGGELPAFYRDADNINSGTLDKARLPQSIDSNTTGEAAEAVKLKSARAITVGNKSNNFDGTNPITFTLPEIGALEEAPSDGGAYMRKDEDWEEFAVVARPVALDPAGGVIDVGETPTLQGSAYLDMYSSAQAKLQVQVHTSQDFSSPVYDTGAIAPALSHEMPPGELQADTTYYWRLRYQNTPGDWSPWSAPAEFKTAAVFSRFIDVPAPTPATFGAAFEGGFYTGLIWNEVEQSASSVAVGVGDKTFTIGVDMSVTPLFYFGQKVEVRSRADPSNRMIGTVKMAVGTTLTVDVASVTGSGTKTDWSVMARYRVIVAPKSSGDTSLALKNANTAFPAECETASEGWRATEAMKNDGNSTVYPAAHWARGLSINSYTDWYIPARDELELCWRNLKPTTANNYTEARANSSISYKTRGAFADTGTGQGENKNSDPAGSGYTTTVPAQTGASAFQTGGAEAFSYGSDHYWSSTEYSATRGWMQHWRSSDPGRQSNSSKDYTRRLRAVRRSII